MTVPGRGIRVTGSDYPPDRLPGSPTFAVRYGRVLRVLRLGMGWTQAEAGKVLGLSRSSVSMIETGRQTFSMVQWWALLAAVAEVPADDPTRWRWM